MFNTVSVHNQKHIGIRNTHNQNHIGNLHNKNTYDVLIRDFISTYLVVITCIHTPEIR